MLRDARALEAAIPPAMQAVDSHLLVAVLGDELLARHVPIRAHRPPAEKKVIGPSLPFDDVSPEVVPEACLDDRQRLNLAALGLEGDLLADVVEVLELEKPQRVLAKPVVNEEHKRAAVAVKALRLRAVGED